MTEDDARAWIIDRFGTKGHDAMARLVELVADETQRHNLISASTIDSIWSRHIVDSAQLIAWGGSAGGLWIDIGSGGGFPGLVIAALSEWTVWLIEPRRRRAEFLATACQELGLGADRVSISQTKIEKVVGQAGVISARAVAPLEDIFAWGSGCAAPNTRWILPKGRGRSAREEVASVADAWHGVFHVEHSITDPASLIVLASGVARR